MRSGVEKEDVLVWTPSYMDHVEEEEPAERQDYADLYEPEVEMPEQYEFTEEAYDEYITMKVMLPMDDRYGKANDIGQKRYENRISIGERNKNSFLDS